jgi:aryl carrier-like protein
MNYVTEIYLDYLDNKEVYQEIYNSFAIKYFLQELTPAQIRDLLTKQTDYLNKLVQHKKNLLAKGVDSPQVMSAVDAKIKAAGTTIGKLHKGMDTADLPANLRTAPRGTEPPPPSKPLGPGELPSGARTAPRGQAPIETPQAAAKAAASPAGGMRTGPRAEPGTEPLPQPATPKAVEPPPGEVPTGTQLPGGERGMTGVGTGRGPVQPPPGQPLPGGERGTTGAGAGPGPAQPPPGQPLPGGERGVGSTTGGVPKEMPQDTVAGTLQQKWHNVQPQIQQGYETSKQAASDVGQNIMSRAKDIAGHPSTPLPSGMAGPPVPGTGLAGAAQTGMTKLGVSPETAGGVGHAIQAIGASPLGFAALGGAAAYGGYKLYKRFLSKSATACRGYSGADKTACMKSFMTAKRNQAASRGAEAA